MDKSRASKPEKGPDSFVNAGPSMEMSYSRRMEDVVDALLSISRKLNSSLDLNGLLESLVTESLRLVDAESGCSGLLTSEGMLCNHYCHKGRAIKLDHCWTDLEGLPGWVAAHKIPYLTNNAATDEQITKQLRSELGIVNALSVPILTGNGEVLGFFEVHNKRGDTGFAQEDQDRLVTVAQQASVAIQNAITFGRLQRTEEALKESDRRKDEFLATLAHELRNPLAPIRNGLELLKIAPKDDKLVSATMPVISRQLEHLVRLVDDLMDVSRISRGDIELRREHLDLRQMIDLAEEAVRPLLDISGHHLTVEVLPPNIYLNADPVRITQVFTNLLNNAVKYTPAGGTISVSATVKDSIAVIVVKDTGLGIPKERLPHVFKMFRRVDQTTSADQRGLGIGLSIVDRLVRMHGGSVTVTSAGPGKGSAFTVRLPAMLKAAKNADGSDHTPSASAHRILIVDDNEDAATTLALLFRAMGQEVKCCHDGASALELAEGDRPHLVVLDIGLPGMDGHEVCRQLRNASWGRSMRIVAFTGWGRKEDRQRAMEAGFDDHYTKPVAIAVLRDLLSKVAQDRRSMV